jgi:hypothetical protein
MDASQIIKLLGGPTKVAAITGARRSAVSNWNRAGIPARYWMPVLDAAKEKDLREVDVRAVQWRPAPVQVRAA